VTASGRLRTWLRRSTKWRRRRRRVDHIEREPHKGETPGGPCGCPGALSSPSLLRARLSQRDLARVCLFVN
jgi:hypothetical protein